MDLRGRTTREMVDTPKCLLAAELYHDKEEGVE